jgi:GNAT superfamily N-acetyltransferase
METHGELKGHGLRGVETTAAIRAATPQDAAVIVTLIEELAEYEKLRGACHADPRALSTHLFGPKPRAEVILAECDGEPVGFALFFHTFSTFECAPSLYVEDIYVRPQHRRKGIGVRLLAHLGSLAVERGCKRMEWAVLDWNRPAIDFYLRLGACPMDEWTVFRLDGDRLEALAGRGDGGAT